ncbi:AIP3-domain-containing protein [Jaminaea rosea]|uniref:AIP3-domain-containing protein n=1 Tax=Jaminaea rosea TaxID=1569628 RepID=A0A316UYS3_9BASI|nr:AIP3-domain-containing protein [Jaminaea rosea]PWN29461.1 AIP3-domain-containing protein [Jaminaea rosea]
MLSGVLGRSGKGSGSNNAAGGASASGSGAGDRTPDRGGRPSLSNDAISPPSATGGPSTYMRRHDGISSAVNGTGSGSSGPSGSSSSSSGKRPMGGGGAGSSGSSLANMGASAAPPPNLLPEEMRALQKEKERERETAINAEMSRQSSGSSVRTSTTASSKSPYSSNHMESSVTRLLVATKMLLESLTKWSIGQKSETQVSDVYVRLGNDFITARQAFGSYNIDMSDLASVPDDLRVCLERCLSEDASPAVLEQHLPRVREIIIHLLQGLKLKQAEYKRILVAQQRGSTTSKRSSILQAAPGVAASMAGERRSSRTIRQERQGVSDSARGSYIAPEPLEPNPNSQPESLPQRSNSSSVTSPRTAGLNGGTQLVDNPTPAPPEPQEDYLKTPTMSPPAAADTSLPGSDPSPYTPASTPRRVSGSSSTGKLTRSRSDVVVADATEADPSLRALKSRDALERRASKRFSAYTFNKMGVGQSGMSSFGSGILSGGGGANASPEMPRSGGGHKRGASRRQKPSVSNISELAAAEEMPPVPKSPNLARKSPLATPQLGAGARGSASTRSSAGAGAGGSEMEELADSASRGGSPLRRTGSQTLGLPSSLRNANRSPTPSTQAASSNESLPFTDANQTPRSPIVATAAAASIRGEDVFTAGSTDSSTAQSASARTLTAASSSRDHAGSTDSPATTGTSDLSVFLQLGRQTRKTTLDSSTPLSVARLRMLFVERFAYSPGKDDFPSIYVKDVSSGVSYELEDLADVTEGCVLTLNIEPLDQVKQHLDLTLGAITKEIREVKAQLAEREQRDALALARRPSTSHAPRLADAVSPSKFSDRQFAAAEERMRRSESRGDDGEGDALASGQASSSTGPAPDLRGHYDEILSLRREMAILRQLQGDFSTDVGGMLKKMKEQSARVRSIAAQDVPTERNFIVAGKARLDASSQEVLTLVEDLQDVVDDLKLDVIQRGVKPKPATVKKISADIAKATSGLEDLERYVQTVKPSWKKTWESELRDIVEEQEFLNHQEGLIADLREDHKALQEVYENIQQVVKLRSAGRPTGGKYIPPLPEEGHEGLSTVMLEVRGQSIDHEKRLRALQAAERTRQREMSSRTDEFQEELAGFVAAPAGSGSGEAAGSGLRKTGGHLEVERIRSKRDKATLLAMFGGGGSGGAPPLHEGAAPPKKLILGGAKGAAPAAKSMAKLASATSSSADSAPGLSPTTSMDTASDRGSAE